MKPLTFEVWPSRTPEEDEALRRLMEAAKEFDPPYVSVTVSDRRPFECTLRTAQRIQEEFGIPAMPHIRCLGRTPSDFCRDVDRVVSAGITHILVLRGDRPANGGAPTKEGLQFAAEGIALIRSLGAPLRIAAACHPETHEDAADETHDLAFLCAKVRTGADFLISQGFFSLGIWNRFTSRLRASGVEVPLVPGVLPLYGIAQAEALTRMSRARIPQDLATAFGEGGDAHRAAEIGRAHTVSLCDSLFRHSATDSVHLFTFNRIDALRWLRQLRESL